MVVMTSNVLGAVKRYRVAAFVVATLAATLTRVLLNTYADSFRFTAAISVATALLSLGAIPLFVFGLAHFKAELKRAYIFLCIGIGIFGLAQLQIPIITIFGLWFWLDSGAAAAVYILSTIPMLLGVRRFARLLQVKSVWSSLLLCILCAVAAAVGVLFLPHVKMDTSEVEFDAFSAIIAWNMFFTLFAGMLVLQIRKVIAETYKQSLAWLAASFLWLAFAGAHFMFVHLRLTDGDWYFDYSVSIIPFGIGALLFIKAGYEFVLAGEVVDGTITAAQPTFQRATVDPLEIVTYIASLASNPSEIDPIMDDIRILTSKLDPNQSLTHDQQLVIAGVYKKLEAYLTVRDPLRLFTKEGIRQNLAQKFGQDVLSTIYTA
jgi:hypothetical protein